MAGLGSRAHQALIEHVVAHYAGDGRIRGVAVFGSVGAGSWHELSDVDLDVVIEDGATAEPAAEVAALFGPRAVIVLTVADAADVVLDSGEEISIRWHPLRAASPNILATARVVAGRLSGGELARAGAANRAAPDEPRLLDTIVRDAIGAQKALARGRPWEAVAAVERMRRSLTDLRGRRDGLRLDPAGPAQALATVLAEIQASYDLGPRRRPCSGNQGSARPCADRPAARAAAAGELDRDRRALARVNRLSLGPGVAGPFTGAPDGGGRAGPEPVAGGARGFVVFPLHGACPGSTAWQAAGAAEVVRGGTAAAPPGAPLKRGPVAVDRERQVHRVPRTGRGRDGVGQVLGLPPNLCCRSCRCCPACHRDDRRLPRESQ